MPQLSRPRCMRETPTHPIRFFYWSTVRLNALVFRKICSSLRGLGLRPRRKPPGARFTNQHRATEVAVAAGRSHSAVLAVTGALHISHICKGMRITRVCKGSCLTKSCVCCVAPGSCQDQSTQNTQNTKGAGGPSQGRDRKEEALSLANAADFQLLTFSSPKKLRARADHATPRGHTPSLSLPPSLSCCSSSFDHATFCRLRRRSWARRQESEAAREGIGSMLSVFYRGHH